MSHKSLRPCLKQQDTEPTLPVSPSPFPFATCSTQRVHFPPSPALTSTHLTHSAHMYDRAPIVVAPNVCALPQRNERTYMPASEKPRKRKPQPAQAPGAFFSPYEGRCPDAPLPPLIPDLSSESDESDSHSPATQHLLPPLSLHIASNAHVPIPYGMDDKSTLAFLPHPPSPEQERGRKRSPSRARGQRALRRSEFAAPELDGCLGGF
ncbi:hypothetical protein BV25DRAFT_1820532 [Artomyces pyxidatus]|uniref:Uncharacterized protein n=1 Tax=Artomyces pyxidatus TaxID=48021 RepID=A0ACB8TDP1_9AGAM|nr:hypothetical protein BV25DRAFT_1820532 [Artomyces pyxidatus]